MYIYLTMKAMPLLMPNTITMIIPDDFEVALAINTLALRKIALDTVICQTLWTGLSGGFMYKSESDFKFV